MYVRAGNVNFDNANLVFFIDKVTAVNIVINCIAGDVCDNLFVEDFFEFRQFFVDNCGYLFYVDNSFYFDLWKNDDYALTEADLATIISGYKNILRLCDNDIDRYFILGDITDFYYQFDPDNKEMEEFENTRNDIFSSLDLEETINKLNDSTGGYYSESLAVE